MRGVVLVEGEVVVGVLWIGLVWGWSLGGGGFWRGVVI